MAVSESTSFDKVVARLGLTPDQYEHSSELKQWVLQNMDEKYVPLSLLKAWSLAGDDAVA
ncbi:MAG: hypothetical protein H0X25_10160 [Acidobacteriales bacterium]|nr:hypothetical protein [Terriglobales bacterium]